MKLLPLYFFIFLPTDLLVFICMFLEYFLSLFSSVQFSRSVISDSLRPHESQHARPPCYLLFNNIHHCVILLCIVRIFHHLNFRKKKMCFSSVTTGRFFCHVIWTITTDLLKLSFHSPTDLATKGAIYSSLSNWVSLLLFFAERFMSQWHLYSDDIFIIVLY